MNTNDNKISKSNVDLSLSTQADGVPDFENRSKTAPAAEAGKSAPNSTGTDDTNLSGSPERKNNENFAKVENEFAKNNTKASKDEENLEADAIGSRVNKVNNQNKKELNIHFSAQDEFKNSQDPSTSGEDIILGRINSSATKLSTAKAASNSSETSNDVKKRI